MEWCPRQHLEVSPGGQPGGGACEQAMVQSLSSWVRQWTGRNDLQVTPRDLVVIRWGLGRKG